MQIDLYRDSLCFQYDFEWCNYVMENKMVLRRAVKQGSHTGVSGLQLTIILIVDESVNFCHDKWNSYMVH